MTGNAIREALEPCPFCGGRAETWVLENPEIQGGEDGQYQGGCAVACAETPWYDTMEEVVAWWNRRVPTAYDARVKALEPFAAFAGSDPTGPAYEGRHDDTVILFDHKTGNRVTIGDLRRARTAYDAIGSDPANVDYEWEAKTAWNCQADDANQWDSLGADEKEGLKAVVAFAIGRGRSFARGDAIGSGVKGLEADDVEWVVNDIAELGVKIGEQFFFLYKGHSLVYGALNPDPTVPPVHDDGTPMHWRPVFKREFGECAHPVNYKDSARIGTVSLDDSDEWKPLPAAALSTHTAAGAGPVDEAVAWRDMASAPKDGTLLALLVRPYANDEDGAWTPFEDSRAPQPTIGFNNFDDTEEDRWQFAGWSWCHDTIVEGHGEVMGWRPFGEKLPSVTPEETVLAAIAEWGEGPCDDLEQLQRSVALALRSHPARPVEEPGEVERLVEETGSSSVDDLRDMALVGHSLMNAIHHATQDGPFKDWTPAEDPAEIVADLVNALAETRERLEKAEAENGALRSAHAIVAEDANTAEANLQKVETALRQSAQGWSNVLELGLLPEQHRKTAIELRDLARTALGDAQEAGR